MKRGKWCQMSPYLPEPNGRPLRTVRDRTPVRLFSARYRGWHQDDNKFLLYRENGSTWLYVGPNQYGKDWEEIWTELSVQAQGTSVNRGPRLASGTLCLSDMVFEQIDCDLTDDDLLELVVRVFATVHPADLRTCQWLLGFTDAEVWLPSQRKSRGRIRDLLDSYGYLPSAFT